MEHLATFTCEDDKRELFLSDGVFFIDDEDGVYGVSAVTVNVRALVLEHPNGARTEHTVEKSQWHTGVRLEGRASSVIRSSGSALTDRNYYVVLTNEWHPDGEGNFLDAEGKLVADSNRPAALYGNELNADNSTDDPRHTVTPVRLRLA